MFTRALAFLFRMELFLNTNFYVLRKYSSAVGRHYCFQERAQTKVVSSGSLIIHSNQAALIHSTANVVYILRPFFNINLIKDFTIQKSVRNYRKPKQSPINRQDTIIQLYFISSLYLSTDYIVLLKINRYFLHFQAYYLIHT